MSIHDRESEAILCYILAAKPSPTLLKRYILAIKTIDDKKPVGLYAFTLSWPSFLRLFDPPFPARSPRQTRFQKRLNAALTLCETSIEGVHRLRQQPGETRAGILLRLFGALLVDGLTMPLRLVVWKFW
jgi:hypothetical protein